MKNLTKRVPNYMQIYFPYRTVTSDCQDSRLARTQTVSIFRMLTYMQMRFRHQNKSFYILQLNYSTNIHLLIPRFMKSLCVVKQKKLTDVTCLMTPSGAFVYVCENL